MKNNKGFIKVSIFIALSLGFCISTQANSKENSAAMYSKAAQTLQYGVDSPQVHLQSRKAADTPESSAYEDENPLSIYETVVPLSTKTVLPRFENTLLTRYLNNPNSRSAASLLAIYHLYRKTGGHSGMDGERLKHLIIAQYFLNRAIELGSSSRWLEHLLRFSEAKVEAMLAAEDTVDLDESREAHKFFIKTFTQNEGDRFVAYEKLLDDIVAHPNSILSAFYINAANLWIGGEVEADDPTILYHFIVGSYFSIYSMELAQRAESAWEADPSNNERFRLANIIGGFSVLQRRWIAELQGDSLAKAALDEEHRQWQAINPAFHAFTIGVPLFAEDDNFLEGYQAWASAFSVCAERPDIRTCPNGPRFTFNQLLMILGFVDYSLKLGDLDTAQLFLSFRYDPAQDFAQWDLGQDAWFHREQNFADIAELYANDDPSDDPAHVATRSHDWSANTSTCQVCHQVQSRVWSQEELDTIVLSPDDILTIGEFPPVLTTWYGSSL